MSNLTQRILTAIIALPIVIYLLVVGGIPFSILIGAAVFVGLHEFFVMMEARGFKPMKTTGYVLGVAFVVVAHFSDEYFLTTVVTFSALIVMVVQLSKGNVQTSIAGMAVTVLGLLYVAWLLSHAVLLRNIGDELVARFALVNQVPPFMPAQADPTGFGFVFGLFFIILVLACTFGNDTGAYFAGRFFGKHRLAPVVSPKKTWEGAIGGVLAAMLFAAGVRLVFDLWIPNGDWVPFTYGASILLGAAIGIAGDVGDLVESLIKRDADIKDSGWIIPGHGGILDRADALLFTFPLTYYAVKIYFLHFS